MSRVYEEDILNAGKNQLIIGNDIMKVIIVPELGGRIADVQFNDREDKYLYRTYPDGVNFGPYTEYGGIEECIGGAPGSLWNAQWRWEQKDNGVFLQALSQNILVQKFISLDEKEPVARIDYSFINAGNNFSKFTFGIHPEVCIGGALRDNQYYIPAGEELLSGGYVEPGFKNKAVPSEGWCAVTCAGRVFGQMFPDGVIDTLEIYYPRVNTHMVLEPLIYGVGVSPDRRAAFTYMFYMGEGDAEKVKEMQASRKAELLAKYEPFNRAEVPEEVIAELKTRLGLEAAVGARPVFVRVPEIPKIPDVGAIVKRAIGNVAREINVQVAPMEDTGGTVKTGDLTPDTEIRIEGLKGNIAIHGWERSYIERAGIGTRGTLDQRGDIVKVEVTGNCSLNVPRDTRKITLNLVSGDVAIFDVASSLKITSVNGKVDIISAKVPDDGTLDISLVKGDINLTIPSDSSFRILARSLSGGIEVSDLEFQKSTGDQNYLEAVMKDGTASIILNTVKGSISISGRTTAKHQ